MDSIIYDKKVYWGRPENISGRSEKEIASYDFLDSAGVKYRRADHLNADTIAVCGQIEALLGAEICKNLFLCNRQQTDFYLLLMDGKKSFKTKDFSKEIGTSRLSFASPENLEKYLNITPGSVSVLGLIFDMDKKVMLYIDKSVIEKKLFGCHPCINTSTVAFETEELINKILPKLGRILNIVDLPVYDE